MPDTEHGTKAAFERHKRRGEEPCDPCRIANSEYSRNYRTGKGKVVQQRCAGVQNCRNRALRKLATLHATQFQQLYDAELDRAGFAQRLRYHRG